MDHEFEPAKGAVCPFGGLAKNGLPLRSGEALVVMGDHHSAARPGRQQCRLEERRVVPIDVDSPEGTLGSCRRIEHHQVELLRRQARIGMPPRGSAAHGETRVLTAHRREVPLHTLKAIADPVPAVVLLAMRQVPLGVVTVDDLLCTAQGRDEAHGAGVGKEVQHAQAIAGVRDEASRAAKVQKQRRVEVGS